MAGLGTGGPPEQFPRGPDITLSYEAFEVSSVLGKGGNADVYRANVHRDGEPITVAIKQPRMAGTLHSDSMAQFVEEAELWEDLDDHGHIVGLLDWGTDPLPWIAMEHMDGGTLADLIETERLPLDQALWVSLCICRAVRYAHRYGIAHHDIKPANILFRHTETGWMVPKVSDWGLARVMLEETGSIEGLSPKYAAPEQFSPDRYGSPNDFTDIYQVGTLAYNLVTGHPPFTGPAPAVMQRVLNEEPDPPSGVADVPPSVDEAIMPALRKDKDDRYDTVVYLRDELEDIFESVHRDAPTAESAGSVPPQGIEEKSTPDADPSPTTATSKPDTEDDEPTQELTEETLSEASTEPIVDEPELENESGSEDKASLESMEDNDRVSSGRSTSSTDSPAPESVPGASQQGRTNGLLTAISTPMLGAVIAVALVVLFMIAGGPGILSGAMTSSPASGAGEGLEVERVDAEAITAGEELTVRVTVSNPGGTEEPFSVSVSEVGDSGQVTIDAGDESTKSFSFQTDPEDAGDHDIEINGNVESTVSIGEPLLLNVENIEPNEPVETEELELEITLFATGNGSATEQIEVTAGALGTWSEELTVQSGETTTVTAMFDTSEGDAGEHTITATSADDSIEKTVVVKEAKEVALGDADANEGGPDIAVTTVETNSPIIEGQPLNVTVTVANTGSANWTGELALEDFNGDTVDYSNTTVVADETTEIAFTWLGEEIDDIPNETVTENVTVRAESELTATVTADAEVEIEKRSPHFSVEIADETTTEVEAVRDDIVVVVDIENIGDGGGEREIKVEAAGDGTLDIEESRLISLGPGESDTLTFEFETSSTDNGEYVLTVHSLNEEAAVNVTIRKQEISSPLPENGGENGGDDGIPGG